MSNPVGKPNTVVFDVGGVLLDWNPRYLYRQLFDGDDQAMEYFLTHICSNTWNLLQDAGRPFSEAVSELSLRYPEYAHHIIAYDQRWEEMIAGAIDASVDILRQLNDRNVPLYAITNFSTEKFSLVRYQFDFFDRFDGIIVSGAVRLLKPDPAIYLRLLNDYDLNAEDCVFIDDSAINVSGAERVGMQAIHFQSAQQLQQVLTEQGLL